MKIFRRIFWANETKQLISKLQLDGLLQDDAEFFDNQNIDLEEALDDFFNVEEKYRKCYTERKKFQELAYQVQNESSHANKITTKNSRISQGVKNLLKNETRRTLFNLDLYENEDRNNKNNIQHQIGVSNNEKNDSDNDNDEYEEEKIGLILSHSKNNSTQNDTEIVEEDPVSLRINRVLDDYIEIILVNNYGSIDAVPKKYNLQK